MYLPSRKIPGLDLRQVVSTKCFFFLLLVFIEFLKKILIEIILYVSIYVQQAVKKK